MQKSTFVLTVIPVGAISNDNERMFSPMVLLFNETFYPFCCSWYFINYTNRNDFLILLASGSKRVCRLRLS